MRKKRFRSANASEVTSKSAKKSGASRAVKLKRGNNTRVKKRQDLATRGLFSMFSFFKKSNN